MKKNFLPVIIGTLVLVTSCVQSLYPLTEDEKQIIFRDELLGQWKEDEGTEYLVDRLDDKTYQVAVIDRPGDQGPGRNFSDTSHFLMTLIIIKGKYFLDCVPDIDRPHFRQLGEQAANFLLPVHYILKVTSISKDSVEIASLDKEHLLKLIEQRKISIGYEHVKEDQVLILQKPEGLQKKLNELENFPTVYEKTFLRRK